MRMKQQIVNEQWDWTLLLIVNETSPYMWTCPDGHEGDLVFISGRLRSASGRLFDSIFNASFQAFFNKIRKEFKKVHELQYTLSYVYFEIN